MTKIMQMIRAYLTDRKTQPRTTEASQVEDALQDVATRSPERTAFEKKVTLKKTSSPKV